MSSEGMPTVRLDAGGPQWEYRVAHIPTVGAFSSDFDIDEIRQYLNGAGLDGWELATMTALAGGNGTTNGLIAVLKRQRR